MRGRTFGLVNSLMRISLLASVAVAPVLAGVIGRPRVPATSTSTASPSRCSSAALLAVAVGRRCPSARWTTARGVPFRTDLVALLAAPWPRGSSGHDGLFVVFEGGEGAGKSTQVGMLAGAAAGAGHEVVVTREPGATPVGAKIRALLLDPATVAVAARRGAALRRRPRAARRRPSSALRWTAARWSSATGTSTARWPTRAPAASSRSARSPGCPRWATEGLRPT